MKSITSKLAMISLLFACSAAVPAIAADASWLPSLTTATPEAGFALAVKLSRVGVKTTQPDMAVLKEGRAKYAKDADSLIAASQVVAIHFQTIAAANNYWK